MTRAPGDTTVYCVCDGHGALGHLVAFRVAQSLPKFVLEGLQDADPSHPSENILAQAFEAAAAELRSFADGEDLDISAS
eukprot:CAMPEP_0168712158 /NCGR_PEP_ID=MMETSP0503-20121227/43517_1 /TAXON_ID=89963 /ORGANISM="Heterocapsa rotundata, Strain SCCAP K-0483" /LENGTH=78 /DNA_ID=CAMNT_0008758529 /DNA_START=62 /DNA_END=295 /DNA_ORIENTATION=-